MKKIKTHTLTTLHFSGTLYEVIDSLTQEFGYYSDEYTNLKLDYDYSCEDGSYYRHTLYGDKLETDEEEALRLKQEVEYNQRQFEFEKRQYEALKAKFEKS
jgi:hypothetical protein